MKNKKQRWKEKQFFCLDVDVFDVDVVVAVDASEKDVMRWMKRNALAKYHEHVQEEINGWDKDMTDGIGKGRMCEMGGGFLVLIKTDESWVETFGRLVHEMTHVVQYLLRNRRIPLTEDTEEVHTYLIEFLITSAARKML